MRVRFKLDITNIYKNRVLKDYNIEKQLDWKPSYVGFREIDNSVFRRGYLFFGPFLLAFVIPIYDMIYTSSGNSLKYDSAGVPLDALDP